LFDGFGQVATSLEEMVLKKEFSGLPDCPSDLG
jgi:hypothetical protein